MSKEHLSQPPRTRKAFRALTLAVALSSCQGGVFSSISASADNSITPVWTKSTTLTKEQALTLTQIAKPNITIKQNPVPTTNPSIKCDQRLVPNAETIPAITKKPSNSFKLTVPILEYHRIVPPQAKGLTQLKVPPATFEAQMKKLHDNNWHTITLAKLAYDLEHEITPPSKTFVVTFDDGYNDGFINAYPILKKYKFVGTFFIITSRINKSIYLTTPQLINLTKVGNEIADHTTDHVSLTYGNPDSQVDSGAKFIAQVTGKWPSTLAYPYGNYNNIARDAVANCQPMRLAVIQETTSGPRVIETWNNRFEIPRIKVYPGTSPASLLYELTPYENKK